ncbi:C4-dicarboxylate ABC transporter permease [Paracoccus sp. S4493]|jgi:C4-dicarboxylate transporter DctM subunit|uniref:TRAP transporter large permease protein n=1 Tax=Paracoccus marcusii TaxID=59779 RepID=A0ABY7UV79_9RHOB|nr:MULTISPECIES: TRAP transporter large permease [Paracoccus]TYP67589.1 tripartite ATP-independent transporter DctM subunit [Stutzerimonas stutzeri]AZY92856.1 TRAP transporter large permease [Paracoccus sp. Arc7-R13]KJZ32810.1 C4-dicarboxylate ABC transporter permease [Paracoccus sp. S4493]MBF5079354.1 TRAP transporter large permease [Paracoccus sp. NBH48]MCO6362365.1 TRAP transporter large permease subunit [Paracoccus sp. 08]
MDPMTIGLVAMAAVLVLLAMRVPIAFALAGVASVGTFLVYATRTGAWMPERALNPTSSVVFSNFFDLVHSYDLSMVPLFVALGNIAFYAGITTRIYDAAAVWLRPVRGGVAMASVLGCGGFSAISGSSIACASTMGRICVPEMLRMGYDPKLATASVAVGGTLGSLIPPSVLFILYGIFTETSIAQLFLAGILPGILSLAGMLLVIAWWVNRDPDAAPRGERGDASRTDAAIAAWPALLLFVVIVGGIYGGMFTATEAAAVSVVLTTIIGFAQRRLTMGVMWRAVRESLVQTAAIFLIAGAAKIFVSFVALTGMAGAVVGMVSDAELSLAMLMLVVVVIYLVLGMFLDPIGIMVLTLPFMVPLIEGYGLNLIWFGVIVVKLLEIGLITPPVGLNVFVVSNVTKSVGIDKIFAGVTRFLAVDMLVLLLLILFPILSLLIPGSM